MADDEDFCAFVVAHQTQLLRFAWVLTADWALAEDLVQTSLMRCWPHWSRISEGNPEAYVRRTLVNTAATQSKRRWRREVVGLPERTLAAADGTDETDVRASLAPALLSLPPRQRAVLALRFLADMSEAQTAEVLGCSVGTVKSSTSKALGKLRLDPAVDVPGRERT